MPEPSDSHEVEIDEIPGVFRDENGLIEFPSIIPPTVDFPATSPADVRTCTKASASAPNAGAPLPRQTRSTDSPRPILSREWQTEKPNHVAGKYTIPDLTRYATSASARNNAIGDGTQSPLTREDDSTSLSSSSSESESESEDEEQISQQKRPGRVARSGTHKPQPKQQSMKSDSRRNYRRFDVGNDDYNTKGKVSKNDGRLNISVNETGNKGYLVKALGATFLKNIGQGKDIAGIEDETASAEQKKKPEDISRISSVSTLTSDYKSMTLNIVIMVIGSRGDIQPFLKVGKVLKEDYGHRVRIATHPAFREFVENDSQLEFFSVGGDPAELMAFMVKNPGMIPKMDTLRSGEVGRRREAMAEMFEGFWRACINATDDEHDLHNLKMMGDKSPFVADAIIANPPCFAHIHCAERLGIPLHLMFTFPYTPTQAFPHPLANIKRTNVDPGYTNFMSYPLVEMMTWQGLGDLVNGFRVKTLGLEPVSTLWAPGQLYRLRVPYTYLWSPGLVPKPKDWGPEIDIAGFVFLDLASTFDPPEALVKFIEAGDPPIYIGFGSIVVDDPDHFTQMIYKGVEAAGVRALVSKGWGGLGDDDVPDNIFLLDNTPHDWLFPRVRAVVHHGGAGTTAIGLKCGKPTMVVPFFGDQFFWGNMIGKAGAGPMPTPYKNLTEENLAEGIKQLLSKEAQAAARGIANDIKEEGDGAHNAVKSFHRCLSGRGQHLMRCTFLTNRLAIWSLKKTNIRLSALAADILVTKKEIHWKQLRLLRHVEWNDFEGPGEPITGGASAIAANLTSMATGIGSIPFRLVKSAKSRQLHEKKQKRKHLRAKAKAEAKSRNRGNSLLPNGSKKATDSTGWTTKDKNKKDLTKGIAKKDILPETKKPDDSKANGQDSNPAERRLSKNKSGTSQTHDDNATDNDSILSAEPDLAQDIAGDVGHGFQKTGEAMLRGTYFSLLSIPPPNLL
jgi:UDP:flavonoid glycosyltransferase YjiC (YdhE family)